MRLSRGILALFDLIEVTRHLRHTFVFSGLLSLGLLGTDGLVAFSQLTQACKRLRAELAENTRKELSELLVLCLAVHSKGVRANIAMYCM